MLRFLTPEVEAQLRQGLQAIAELQLCRELLAKHGVSSLGAGQQVVTVSHQIGRLIDMCMHNEKMMAARLQKAQYQLDEYAAESEARAKYQLDPWSGKYHVNVENDSTSGYAASTYNPYPDDYDDPGVP